MGKRARRRGAAPGRTAARRAFAERQLGIQLSGVTKPMLDLMNAESKDRFQLGIGVLVQEEERERAKARSLRAELNALIMPARWFAFGLRKAARDAEVRAETWTDRLAVVAAAVSDKAPGGELERWRASR